MLDDLKLIHERDAQDALGIAEKQAGQYSYDFNFEWTPPRDIHEVVVAGMGGSGLAAKAYKVIAQLRVPFEVVQDYTLPPRAGDNSLVICSSYSGNTEEEVSMLEQILDTASRPGSQPLMVVVIASGGKLMQMAADNNLPFIQLPTGYQPRHTFGFQYRALCELFATTSLTENQVPELEASGEWLASQISLWTPTVPTADNVAKQIALDVIGKSVVVYAGPKLAPAAYKWKISFNENAKHIAWTNQFPEFNHNEFLGWTKQPVDKPYCVIDLRSNLEHPRVQKRFEVSARLLSGMRPAPVIVETVGETILNQLMWVIALGDFVTLYTALLNGINPTPVDLIEEFKKVLDQ